MHARFTVGSLFLGVLLAPTAFLSAEEPNKKGPVPDEETQAASLKVVKEVYGDEYAKAKTTTEKQALARKIIQRANAEREPVARFVLYRLARDIATQGSDGQTAFQAIDEMAKSVETDPLEMKTGVLVKFAAMAKTTEQRTSLAEKAVALADDAVAQESFALAKQLNELALAQATQAKDKPLQTRAVVQASRLDEVGKAHDAMQKASATLEKSPTDRDANLAAGKYKCFFQADWDEGLPLLALGGDAGLAALATKELKQAASARDEAAMGDGWWELGEKETGIVRQRMRERAAYWYQKAMPGLDGLFKDRVAKRLDGMTMTPKPPAKTTKHAAHPPDALRFGGHYYRIFWERLSWSEAEARCQQMGGHLACIETPAERAFLATYKGAGKVVLVGARSVAKDNWQWVNGKPCDKRDIGGEGYAAFSKDTEYMARPLSGHTRKLAVKDIQGFLCEWE